MSYIKQVAEMLGVKLEERFKITDYEETWYIDDCGLNCEYDDVGGVPEGPRWDEDAVLREILCGETEIVKLPWMPKKSEEYWYLFDPDGSETVWHFLWNATEEDCIYRALGNCFRTKEEAEAAIPWYKENIERIKRGEKWQVEK